MKRPRERTIVLIRHGQTDFNKEKRIQDPIVPRLTELGHAQAKILAEQLKKAKIKFDLIICADTTRTKETLKDIYPDFEKMINIKVDGRLQERYHKDLIGKNKAEIERIIGEVLTDRLSWHLYFEGTNKSKLTGKFNNDETLSSIERRVRSLLNEIANKSTVLLIGSSIVNQYVLEFMMQGTIGKAKTKSPDGLDIDFQKHNEIRMVKMNEDKKGLEYKSLVFQS